MKSRLLILSIFLLLPLAACNRSVPPAEFEPNRVFAYVSEVKIEYPMQQALIEAQVALGEYFGTPDQPKLPGFLDTDPSTLVDLKNLEAASGDPQQAGRGLYRKHCVACHGITGNGRGVNATQGDVYPRDFRMGKFKFKSTARGAKPLRDDLFRTIRNGIAGTSMARINELSDADVQSLVDYVIYLSWRGDVERRLLLAAEEIEFESEDQESLRNLYAPGTKLFEEQQVVLVKDSITEVADEWSSATESIKEIPAAGDIPVEATLEELLAAASSSQPSPLKASLDRGRELFVSETASCAKCHGPLGHGDGQNQDYDDWTKEWTKNINIDPTDDQQILPFQVRGAMPPRQIKPRDLREGIYRGGADPKNLYHRIANGIEGTPMPAAEGVLQPQDIWHLVNYVRSLATPTSNPTTGESKL